MDPGVTVVLNPRSGTDPRHDLCLRIERSFRERKVPVTVVPALHGREIVAFTRRALAQGASAIAAAGGDGTVHTVASVLAGTETPFAVIPAGTLNHFAKDMQIPLDLEGAIDVIAGGRTMLVDVAEVNGRVFLNNSSLGLYPTIVEERVERQRMGHGKWPAFVWAALTAFRRYPFLMVRLDADGHKLVRQTPFVFVGNNVYQMEGLHIGSRASLCQGTLSLYVTHRAGRLGLLRLSVNALLRRLNRVSNFDALCAREIWVETLRRRLPVALDGELYTMESPLRYCTRPACLRVLVP